MPLWKFLACLAFPILWLFLHSLFSLEFLFLKSYSNFGNAVIKLHWGTALLTGSFGVGYVHIPKLDFVQSCSVAESVD